MAHYNGDSPMHSDRLHTLEGPLGSTFPMSPGMQSPRPYYRHLSRQELQSSIAPGSVGPLPQPRPKVNPQAHEIYAEIRKRKGWTCAKWILLVFNTLFLAECGLGIYFCASIWSSQMGYSDVIKLAHRDILLGATVITAMMVITCLLGYIGIFKENKAYLTFYAVFLWPVLIGLAVMGYISFYKVTSFGSPEIALSTSWDTLTSPQRLIFQSRLQCCGFSSPEDRSIPTFDCNYATSLPGCINPWLGLAEMFLTYGFLIPFGSGGFNIILIFVSILSSNHVTPS